MTSGLLKAGPVGLKPSPFHAEHFGISYVIFAWVVSACIEKEGRALALYIDLDNFPCLIVGFERS